ncbi:hypothetical protein THAOC_12988 [Thalassiosira oceanica]|uniref:Uncharacterized protein n=1 Tax=Thalassiosira oceanica TaxID=159749 RepID=K0T6P6_THAOC|nr:hypothetical protein THAOC_12988 [Thalassiosira oceanica]|eukprot:EJK66107.1 hypothetical protein THAOC_12988 [Thalassiosira oceanica]
MPPSRRRRRRWTTLWEGRCRDCAQFRHRGVRGPAVDELFWWQPERTEVASAAKEQFLMKSVNLTQISTE